RRLVRSKRRSTLGDWVVAIEAFPDGSTEREMLESVASFYEVPTTTSVSQAMDFLSWVWGVMPEVDRVRGVLSRAYSYLLEDLAQDSVASERWALVKVHASVFVQPQRRWVSVWANERVYFDDVNHPLVSQVTPELELATPGHLGENLEEQL